MRGMVKSTQDTMKNGKEATEEQEWEGGFGEGEKGRRSPFFMSAAGTGPGRGGMYLEG